MPSNTETLDLPWINPVGGLGDVLMLSGVLKQVHDRDGRRFHLVRRTNYVSLLTDHPAIASIGHPPRDATLLRNDYWSMERLGPGNARAYQVLARGFGLTTPVAETLYVGGDCSLDEPLAALIPWGKPTVLIAPASASPRKAAPHALWEALVKRLRGEGVTVLQAGQARDRYVRGTYSLLGLTTPRQLISLAARCNLVISADNFIMHAVHLTGTPAVILWGPTDPAVYGYDGQTHLRGPRPCPPGTLCIGPEVSEQYPTPCPLGDKQCTGRIELNNIWAAVSSLLH